MSLFLLIIIVLLINATTATLIEAAAESGLGLLILEIFTHLAVSVGVPDARHCAGDLQASAMWMIPVCIAGEGRWKV